MACRIRREDASGKMGAALAVVSVMAGSTSVVEAGILINLPACGDGAYYFIPQVLL